MHVDEIELGWGEKAYVWVRPTQGGDWSDTTHSSSDRGKTDWRPALLEGFSEDGWAYGTVNDTRKLTFFGRAYSYPDGNYKIGGLMDDFEPTHVATPSAYESLST